MPISFVHLDEMTTTLVILQGLFATKRLPNLMLDTYSRMAAAAASILLLGAVVEPTRAQAQPASQTATENTRQNTQLIAAGTNRSSYQTLYVDPEIGSDGAAGVADQPMQTVTRALEVAAPNTVIVLAPGRYTQASGEVFPLQLKSGVTIQGTPGSRARSAIIEGGGTFNSPSRSQQNAAVVAADRAGIAQVAISNPDGYGVWIEAASPTILESAFIGSRQTGIYVTDGSPRVQGSYFSGNRVAGLIVFGASSANIERNTFDGTGDAIRVVDGATPEIVGNRMTNNDAGLVLIGNAKPVVRDNRMEGNRRNDVVEVAARTQSGLASVSRSIALAPTENADIVPGEVVGLATEDAVATEIVAPAAERPLSIRERLERVRAEQAVDDSASSAQLAEADSSSELEADAVVSGEIPAGAPGSALAALQSGLPSEPLAPIVSLAPRAVTGRNPDSPTVLPRNRRPEREREESRPEEDRIRRSEDRIRRPVNNNRLAVPSSTIPIGSGGSSTVFSPPNGGFGSPPAPPSRAQSLGLYYRVFVEASDPFVQDEVREVVPDSFRTRFEGRTMMQVGAFPTEEEARERQRLLERNDFDARVEYIR